jgi:site-specific DNA recombinase
VTEAVRAALSASALKRMDSALQGASGSGAPTNPRNTRLRRVDHETTLRAAVERVVLSRTTIEIELAESAAGDDHSRILTIPWTPPLSHRRREIIQSAGERPSTMRPMRGKARAILIDALRDAHHWLDELTRSPNQTIEALAVREGKTERSIRTTLSLAFLCPTLVKAAIEGRLPSGFGVRRMIDLPINWSKQLSAPGLKAPVQL